ncbi:MAG: hypothetical protein AB2660_02635 [Candidatus Thiodiazotropha sp.]
MAETSQKSWFARTFGRSVFSMVFGKFFEVKNNSAGVIAVTLVLTLCFIAIYVVTNNVDKINSLDQLLDGILNIIFVVVGYYFGAAQRPVSDENDDE